MKGCNGKEERWFFKAEGNVVIGFRNWIVSAKCLPLQPSIVKKTSSQNFSAAAFMKAFYKRFEVKSTTDGCEQMLFLWIGIDYDKESINTTSGNAKKL